ncbi:hypothetical protein AIOL_003251 [Candidatus Rhodobacter oscarellae]|uniref:GAF domain-containing protein n=1 Tax=Candidatus Rhodobacter oscarellae TaxID=1675527 RepID=A0A0J9E681_9RHOB|nr:GAF domain-containing protein [Candidatus Rhodobacter lobularis]KMW58280.1 hypothetical protein AIOL_003251 [Candidatus Rhodobacter lobularis]
MDCLRLQTLETAPDLYAALDQLMAEIVGHKLFTLMVIDHATREAARVYSSNPEAYPVKGRKPLGGMGVWGAQVLDKGMAYIGEDADDLRSVFPDHETIRGLGCESVLNVPVYDQDTVIGTMNLLHEAHWYCLAHIARCAPFAASLAPRFAAWSAQSHG